MCLYRRVLGEGFDVLPLVLQRFHEVPARATGTVRVTRGAGRFVTALATLLRLPTPGEHVPVTLEVREAAQTEHWVRHFGPQSLVTKQWQQGALLCESAGPLRLGFQVQANATGMEFVVVRCWFCGVPLPRALSPRVQAQTRGTATGWWLQVSVEAPGLGLLTRYEGELTPC